MSPARRFNARCGTRCSRSRSERRDPYAQIARQIGNPDAVRAVGAANGRNPVSIVAPCHRVIGSTGKLTGFGGGLDVKARLLALERALSLSDSGDR